MKNPPEGLIPCSDAVRQLWSYLDSVEPSREFPKVEQHLAFCRKCCGELEFAKELRRFLVSHEVEEIPPDVRNRLEGFLEEL